MLAPFTLLLEEKRKEEAISLLTSLNNDERKQLGPLVKRLAKKFLTHQKDPLTGSWRPKATPEQEEILKLAALISLNQTEYTRIDDEAKVLHYASVTQVLGHYCPGWLSNYINDPKRRGRLFYRFGYLRVVELEAMEYLHPSPELIAALLPETVLDYQRNVRVFRSANLFKYPITLEKHLWYIFQYESGIHWNERYAWLDATHTVEQSWPKMLLTLARRGEIDRQRLLRETVSATTRNFDKPLTGWFVDLLTQLNPSTEELLALQPELMATLYSPHRKPINAALKYLKNLAVEDQFDQVGFLEHTPVLLTSETKSVVTSTLMIMEKVVKGHPTQANLVSELACQAFIHPDNAVQTKAAKLIIKYGNPSDPALQQTVSQYYSDLYSDAKHLLENFVAEAVISEPLTPNTLASYQLPDDPVAQDKLPEPIPPVETIDDLIFLASQAFDNHQPFHFDLVPAAFIRLHDQIRGGNIAKLTPAFQRAYQLLMQDWRSSQGFLDHMLATFLVDYGQHLMQQFPLGADSLRQLHEEYLQKERDNKAQWSLYNHRIKPLSEWNTGRKDLICRPFKLFLLEALEALCQPKGVPLLSTPTHIPYWIDPVVLVERLQQYQQRGMAPGVVDWQLAIARTTLKDTETAVALARQQLHGEYQELMLFLLDQGRLPQGNITYTAAWMTAALTKQPTTAYHTYEQFAWPRLSGGNATDAISWEVVAKEHQNLRYNYKQRKFIKEKKTRKLLKLDTDTPKPTNSFGKIISKLFSTTTKTPELVIHQNIDFSAHYLFSNDLARFFSLVPNYPEPLLVLVVQCSLSYATFGAENDKKLVIATLEALLVWDGHLGEAAHLLVATSMLCSDKTARILAAELWIKGVREDTLDSQQMGTIIGEQEKVGFAPLKRFNDLILEQLWQLSEHHQQALAQLLIACLVQLPNHPIKHLKKLLEIYREVIVHCVAVPESALLQSKLQTWRSVPNLTKVVDALATAHS